MIIIDHAHFKFLQAGRTITIPTTTPARYTKGRTYALGVKHNHALCRVLIHDTTNDTILIRMSHEDAPLYLAARSQYGYTQNRTEAYPEEPEPVKRAEITRLTRVDRERRDSDLAGFRERIQREAAELEQSADRVQRRRLEHLRRLAAGL